MNHVTPWITKCTSFHAESLAASKNNNNSFNGDSDENDSTRFLFTFLHDDSSMNERNNYVDLSMLQEEQN